MLDVRRLTDLEFFVWFFVWFGFLFEEEVSNG